MEWFDALVQGILLGGMYAQYALGMALMKLGRYPEAIEVGKKTVELQPNDQLAWSSLSLFYVRANMIPEAEAAGAKAKILSWGGKLKKP